MARLQSIHAQIIVALALDRAGDVGRLLSLLEADPALRPEYWGPSAGIRDPYNRRDLLSAVENSQPEPIVPVLRRLSSIDSTAKWYRVDTPLSSVHIEASGVMDSQTAARFGDSIDALVAALPVDFASVDYRFRDQPVGTELMPGAHAHHLGAYCRWGIEHVFARNYFGPRLQRLAGDGDASVGRDRLQACGSLEKVLVGQSLRLDLVPLPWEADPAVAKEAQRRMDACLQEQGVLFSMLPSGAVVPAPKWRPPDPAQSD